MVTPPVVDRAGDGTPRFAPRGELPVEDGGGRVQCHLCGRWFRQLGSSHVLHAHGMTASEYRLLAGLRPRHPLQAPDLSATRAARLRRRITTDARLISGMAAGVALARNGELQRKADQALRARTVALERERQLAASGARLGSARAVAYRQRREQRARALGFAALEDFYRSRPVTSASALGLSDSRQSSPAPRARCGGICRGWGWGQIAHAHTARDGGSQRDLAGHGPRRPLNGLVEPVTVRGVHALRAGPRAPGPAINTAASLPFAVGLA